MGILGSFGVAWFGIRINTYANSRTAFASLLGKPYSVMGIPMRSGMSIGVLLIDDHRVVRQGLRDFLELQDELEEAHHLIDRAIEIDSLYDDKAQLVRALYNLSVIQWKERDCELARTSARKDARDPPARMQALPIPVAPSVRTSAPAALSSLAQTHKRT